MYRRRGRQCKASENTQNNDNKARRSSLQVNLSYTFDLSDSENTDCSQNTNNGNTTTSINDDISRVLANINDKDEALSKNCSRLRDAILHKTRQLFDKQNDFCQMTTKVMESRSNPTDEKPKLNRDSPILRSSHNCNVNKSSPRKTRSFTRRERLNSFIPSNSQSSDYNDGLANEITSVGSPIICSTFTDHHCDIHETCNVKRIIQNPVKNVNIPREQTTPTFGIKVIQETTPVTTRQRLSIRNIQTCNVKLDRIDGFRPADKSGIVQEISMDLTNVQGNCILNKSPLRNGNVEGFDQQIEVTSVEKPSTTSKICLSDDNLSNIIDDDTSSAHSKPNVSMCVNTSLNPLGDDGEKLNDRNSQVSCHQDVDAQPDSTNGNIRPSAMIDLSTDCDDFEDVSLIQRLRNISRRNSEEKCIMPIQQKVNESPGVVEGTPFAMTRSMLLRTQAKLNSLEDKTKSQCTTVLEVKNHSPKSNAAIETIELEKTIRLDSTPFRLNNPAAVIIQESSDDESNETPQPNNDVRPIVKRPVIGKKKLFTQHDSSGLASFSPLSNDVCSPQVSKLKRLKRRRIMRNVAGRIIKPQPAVGKSQRLTFTQVVLTSSSTSSQDSDRIREFEKVRKKKRAIKSKKIVVKKPFRPNLLKTIDEVRDRSFDGDPQTSRRSSVFQTKKKVPIKRNYGNQRILIVATGLCNGDKEEVKNAVKKLKSGAMESSVSRKTTHVVTTGVRTINLLRGIIRGCWLVKFDWIKKSVEAGKWLPAENFEIDHFSKAVEENRRDREIFGNSYVPDLFATCGLIHVQNDTLPPREILKELIKTAGGLIIEEPKKSKIIIGRDGIKENWVLDSITTGELQSIESYKRSN